MKKGNSKHVQKYPDQVMAAAAALLLDTLASLAHAFGARRHRLRLEEHVAQLHPRLVVVMSGKRKSGKDYTAEKLLEA